MSWQVREERFLMMLQWIAWGMVLGIACFLALLFLQPERHQQWRTLKVDEPGDRCYSRDRIGGGPLALNGTSSLFSMLTREILLLGKNTRPDVKKQDAEIALSLCSSGQQQLVKNGSPVFLDIQMDQLGRMQRIEFAQEPTEFWITPNLLDAQSILIEVGDSPFFSDTQDRQFILEALPSNVQSSAALRTLQTATLFGCDLFFQCYGESQYRTLGQKQRLEFSSPEGGYSLFLEKGDFLSWNNEKWHFGANKNAMLASVQQISDEEMVLQVWDESGFDSTEVKILRKQPEGILNRVENFLSGVRRSTSAQVVATLGNKKVILKKGDWLIQIKNEWRNLRSLADIEAYLNYTLRGPLFVFDGIELAADGKPVLRGNLFDETRTLIQPVVIPVYQSKGLQKGKNRRKK